MSPKFPHCLKCYGAKFRNTFGSDQIKGGSVGGVSPASGAETEIQILSREWGATVALSIRPFNFLAPSSPSLSVKVGNSESVDSDSMSRPGSSLDSSRLLQSAIYT